MTTARTARAMATPGTATVTAMATTDVVGNGAVPDSAAVPAGAGAPPGAARELLLLQICDSVFPIGAYSHSYGLETYIQLGIVSDEDAAARYVDQQVRWPLTYTELLGMRLAYEAAAAGDLARVAQLEALMAAAKVPAECRDASRRMAARFCKTAASFLSGEAAERFSAYVGGAAARGSHMVNAAYGVFCALAGIDERELLRRYLYAQVSAMVVNCVKTVPLSQTAGQEILFASAPAQAEAVERALAADESLLGLSMPGFDTRSIEHETLYSRLYMS